MIKEIGAEWTDYIASRQDMYPEAMREDVEVFDRLLKSGMCWGYFDDTPNNLVGWVLCEQENIKTVYCYDLAVFVGYQGRHIGQFLWIRACKELRWLGYWIHAHCRKQSYGIVINYGPGYKIISDRLILDHYAKEYGDDSLIGEHAHEVLLAPIGQ